MKRRQRAPLSGPAGSNGSEPTNDLPVPQQLLQERLRETFSLDFLTTVTATGRKDLRDRLLPLPLVALLLLSFVVRQAASFLDILDDLRAGLMPGVRAVHVSSQAFYQRLVALGHERFLVLLRQVTQHLAASAWTRPWVAPLAPFARGIYAMDDTTLDALVRRVDWLRPFAKGELQTLAGRLGCLLDLNTGKLAEVLYDSDSAANEKTHLRPLLSRLAQGALVVMDLGYFAFQLFDWMTDQGLYFVTRMRAKTTFVQVHVLAERPLYRDRIVYLGAHRSDRASHPVRLVELCIDGVWWRYLTNVLDPTELPAAALWRLYMERWTIEMCFAAIKRSLGLATLRCTNLAAVLIQVWTTLTVYQVMQDLRLELACVLGAPADDISWTNLMRRIARYAEQPSGKPPLRQWLRDNAPRLALTKRGTRPRRARTLPDDVLHDTRLPLASPSPDILAPRTPRLGKPEPVRVAVLTVAELSTPASGPEPSVDSG